MRSEVVSLHNLNSISTSPEDAGKFIMGEIQYGKFIMVIQYGKFTKGWSNKLTSEDLDINYQ